MTTTVPLIQRIHRERVLLVGGGRALIMQLAHPKVAAAVAEHSEFPDDALKRLRRTLDLTLAMVFGTEAEADQATSRIRGVHERVSGVAGGEPYRADDPRLLMWVHATLIDSTLAVYEGFVRSLSDEERRRYYEESKRWAGPLGITDEVLPQDLDAFRMYVEGVIEGPELQATDEGRRLAASVLRPPLPLPLRPAVEAQRLLTLALLPDRIRRMFGLRAGPAARLALATASRAARVLLPVLPDRLRAHTAAR